MKYRLSRWFIDDVVPQEMRAMLITSEMREDDSERFPKLSVLIRRWLSASKHAGYDVDVAGIFSFHVDQNDLPGKNYRSRQIKVNG